MFAQRHANPLLEDRPEAAVKIGMLISVDTHNKRDQLVIDGCKINGTPIE